MFITTSAAPQVDDGWEAFARPEFRDDLELLATSVRADGERWAEQAIVTARLAAQVPCEAGITRTATAWKSFVREIAVARRCSDQAAAKEIYLSVALTTSHPKTLAFLQTGRLPLYNARVLLEESAGCESAIGAAVDAELAERACRLTPSRIRDAVRQIELRMDADAAAARSAKATATRNVRLSADRDDQATIVLSGPALPLVQFYETVTAAARAARAAGDPRGIDALRFDLALDVPAEVPVAAAMRSVVETGDTDASEAVASEAGGPDERSTGSVVPSWLGDRRLLRPIQALLNLSVTTALGLDNEPGWLHGYGWVSAPQCRQWLTEAELRQVCVGRDGFVLDTADRVVRPEPTPVGVRDAVLAMVSDPGEITDKTFRSEPRHDPSPALAGFVDVRDLDCDGPTGTRVPASRCEHDHDIRYPDGPTAAWNLKPRATRTHVLKYNGWTPLRTATATLWFSPAGQIVEVPHHTGPPPDLDPDAELPDPQELHDVEAELLRPPGPDDQPPWDAPPF
ncbi:MAG: hypothetical protein JWP11_891 [Frankiales bacterium]|nr:hypothetical protein [Frankiales bacterium]